jgi:hypothetical protein
LVSSNHHCALYRPLCGAALFRSAAFWRKLLSGFVDSRVWLTGTNDKDRWMLTDHGWGALINYLPLAAHHSEILSVRPTP